jgi:hypothetical protein
MKSDSSSISSLIINLLCILIFCYASYLVMQEKFAAIGLLSGYWCGVGIGGSRRKCGFVGSSNVHRPLHFPPCCPLPV